MKKSQRAYEGHKTMCEFVGESCGPDIQGQTLPELEQQYNQGKEELAEIDALIEYMQDIDNEEEVAFLRRMQMQAKMIMREIKEMMMVLKNNEREVVYS